MRPTNVEAFFAWIQEREEIRRKKLGGAPAPWTEDRYLAKYRFCNVRRRHDRASQWIIKRVLSIRVPDGSLGLAQLGMFLALCRWVNWPPTIQELIDRKFWPSQLPDWRGMGEAIDARMKRKEQTWTGAYMIRAESNPEQPWYKLGKGVYIADIVVRREMTNAAHRLKQALRDNTREAVHAVLQSCYGWGSFMAGQVVDDWSWTPLLHTAKDHFTWAPQGPGSVRGFNRLYGEPFDAKIEEEFWIQSLRALRDDLVARLGNDYEDVTLMDLQNCLCEFDKYERVRLGQGRPRNIYRPETAY